MKTLYRNTLITLVVASLAACGGGGSSGNNADDRDSNTPGISGNEALTLLQEGLYEFDLYVDDAPPFSGPTLAASRDRLGLNNGILTVDSHFIVPTGWMTESEYYDLIGSTESRDLILTADGWRERATVPCLASADGNDVVLDCAGNRQRISLGAARSLGGSTLSSELLRLADETLPPRPAGSFYASAFAALHDAVSTLATALGSPARAYTVSNVDQHAEAVILDCTPTAAEQPESEWSCDTNIASTSWEELSSEDDTFTYQFIDPNGNFKVCQVYLDGDLIAASTGNIVVVEDHDEELTPGTVIGAWSKHPIHGQDIIALETTGESESAGSLNALFMVNGKIVMGVYNPAGERYTGTLYNAAAGNALSDAIEALFPLSFDE